MSIKRGLHMRRSRMRFTSLASAFLCLGFFLAAPISRRREAGCRKALRDSDGATRSVTVEESFEAFHSVLNADRDFAPAHYEIAKLYMSLDTPMDRQSAWKAVKNAVRLDRGNVTYRLVKGISCGHRDPGTMP